MDILAGLHLTLKDSKTAITSFGSGFTFLGVRFGGMIEAECVQETALEKPLYIRHPLLRHIP